MLQELIAIPSATATMIIREFRLQKSSIVGLVNCRIFILPPKKCSWCNHRCYPSAFDAAPARSHRVLTAEHRELCLAWSYSKGIPPCRWLLPEKILVRDVERFCSVADLSLGICQLSSSPLAKLCIPLAQSSQVFVLAVGSKVVLPPRFGAVRRSLIDW